MGEEEVAWELEALQATYGAACRVVSPAAPLTVAVALAPRGAGGFGGSEPASSSDGGRQYLAQYCEATLVLQAGPGYPAELPRIELQDVKGLGDARAADVLAALRAEAEAMKGELALGGLVEAGLDALTQCNSPEGDCAFCLLPLGEGRAAGAESSQERGQGGAGPSARALPPLRLPCYHCFHMPCFARWWRWQQRALRDQVARLRAELGAAADWLRAGGGGDPALHAAADGTFPIRCPTCRLLVPVAELAGLRPHLLRAGRSAQELQQQQLRRSRQRSQIADEGDEAGAESAAAETPVTEPAVAESAELEEAESADGLVGLGAQTLARLRAEQAARAAAFRQQQERGAIVEDSYVVALAALALAQPPRGLPLPPPPHAAPASHAEGVRSTQPPAGKPRPSPQPPQARGVPASPAESTSAASASGKPFRGMPGAAPPVPRGRQQGAHGADPPDHQRSSRPRRKKRPPLAGALPAEPQQLNLDLT